MEVYTEAELKAERARVWRANNTLTIYVSDGTPSEAIVEHDKKWAKKRSKSL